MDRVCSVMSVGRMSEVFHYINVRVEVPYGSYNKLICKSTRLLVACGGKKVCC